MSKAVAAPRVPPSQLAVAEVLKPGDHISHNGGHSTCVVARVTHDLNDDTMVTTVHVRRYYLRHLTEDTFNLRYWPVRMVDGFITITGNGFLQKITAEQAAEWNAEVAVMFAENDKTQGIGR